MTDGRRWSGRIGWLVLLLGGVVLLAVLFYRGDSGSELREELAGAPQEESAAAGGDWVFRGGEGLTGVSGMRLGEALRLRWTFQAEGEMVGSAAVVGESAYFGCDAGKVYAVALRTGKRRWVAATEGAVEAPPVFSEGQVLVGCTDGYLYALDAADGSLRWRLETDGKIVGAATVVRQADEDAVDVAVGGYDQRLYLLTAAGEQRWQAEADNYINGAAALSDVGLVFGSCDGLLRVVGFDGELRGQVDCGDYLPGSAAIWGDYAYVGSAGGHLLAVDLTKVLEVDEATAEEDAAIIWRFADQDGGIFSSPAVSEEVVLFGSRDQRVYCLERTTGELRWEFVAGDAVDSSPVVAGDKVVVGCDDGRLYVLRLGDGSEVSRYDLAAAIRGEPALGNGVVVVCGEDGLVHCFE